MWNKDVILSHTVVSIKHQCATFRCLFKEAYSSTESCGKAAMEGDWVKIS